MYAWEKYFENKVTKIRNDELAYMKKAALLNAFANAACLLTPYLVSIVISSTKYIVFHKIGTPLFSFNNFSKC